MLGMIVRHVPSYTLPCWHHHSSQWGVVAGRTWELLEGLEEGQTQLDQAEDGEMIVWAHPLDMHYACKGITGWPKLHFQVWSQDIHGRNDICKCLLCSAWERQVC